MEGKEGKVTDPCKDQSCPKDPEDILLDVRKMTPEEMRNYLDSLLRTRVFGC